MKKKRSKQQLDLSTYYDFLFRKGINLRGRVITISEEIDEKLFSVIDAALSEFESKPARSVTIRINSPGGSIYSALAIVGRMKRSKCRIITEGYGQVMSAATLILAAGNVRRISRLAWFMHHEMSYYVEGRHSFVKGYVAQADQEEEEWCKAMASFSDEDEEFWKKAGISDSYFRAPELIKLGVADALI